MESINRVSEKISRLYGQPPCLRASVRVLENFFLLPCHFNFIKIFSLSVLSLMPDSAFNIWLENNVRILVIRSTQKGRYVSFAVVLTMQTEQGWVDVARFDTAHGIPHQDILGKKAGLLQKIWYDDISPKEVFHLAITTFQKDYELIINAFKRN